MIIEFIGPPGSGKTYLSKKLYKGYLYREDIHTFRSVFTFLSYILNHIPQVLFLIKNISLSNRKRIKNIIFESYLLYIIKYKNLQNVVLDQSLIQAITALSVETDDTSGARMLFDRLLDYYRNIIQQIVFVQSEKNLERLSKREVNLCSFNIHDQNEAEVYIDRYYSFIQYLCDTRLKGVLDVEIRIN